MYSRYSSGFPEKKIHVPEHYSGCAFPTGAPTNAPSHALDIARPTPPPQEPERAPLQAPPCAPPDEAAPPPPQEEKAPPHEPTATHALTPSLPFADGLDFDQLLILGLILLLSHSGTDSDIILWLGLLLFCG